MQATDLARNNEGNGFYRRCGELVGTRDLALGDVKRASGKEAHASLGVGRLVLREAVKLIGLVLVVADVAISIG